MYTYTIATDECRVFHCADERSSNKSEGISGGVPTAQQFDGLFGFELGNGPTYPRICPS